MISADLNGKCVLVTGGLSGIGLAAVKTFAACGARVAVNHLPNDPATKQVLDELNQNGYLIVSAPGDVSDPDQTETMVEQAIETLGRLDVLINNAGTSNTREPIAFDDLDAMSEAFWAKIMQTNLIGAFRCARAASPALRSAKGVIVLSQKHRNPDVYLSSLKYCVNNK
jgi:3-oxoacyl-[acyl-carrier protein] reductase